MVVCCTGAACGLAGYTQDRFYIHCDGALFGMMMPFIKEVGATKEGVCSGQYCQALLHCGLRVPCWCC